MTSMGATIMIMRCGRAARTPSLRVSATWNLRGAPGGCRGKRARYKGRAKWCASRHRRVQTKEKHVVLENAVVGARPGARGPGLGHPYVGVPRSIGKGWCP